jgi:aerobic-type carbon monoxide dehydrogenase small subunit (CoxS/CutS family)
MPEKPERVRKLMVNGSNRAVDVPPDRNLLSVLRDDLDLTGAKYGCGEGQCGACTVLVDGKAVRACITPIGAAAGKPILTIEGMEQNGRLHPVQQAFLDAEAFQCGYCTPGMILAAAALLRENGNPSESEIRRQMNGNICRCGTYPRIVAAVRAVAETEGRVRQ